MKKNTLDKSYVSEHDIFLTQFDKDHPDLSLSQLKEIKKHQRIAALRDGAQDTKPAGIFKRLFRVFYA